MRTLTLPSPAKLNISLEVINKRPDGYHNLKTIFERIDLCDRLRFQPTQSGRIEIQCAHPQVPKGKKNLIYQAAVALKDLNGCDKGAIVHIDKKIPVAAGLAGGSSNAAAALLGLNQVWDLRLSRKKLIQLAARLGSDVPFFLHDCSWGLGQDRGDRIKNLAIRAKFWHILVIPRVKMYSREVFTRLNLKLTKTGDNVNILIRSLKSSNIIHIGNYLRNDLESSILAIRPSLMNVKKRLLSFQLAGVSFSGSGPSVFGLVRSQQEALQLQNILKKRYAQVFVVRTF